MHSPHRLIPHLLAFSLLCACAPEGDDKQGESGPGPETGSAETGQPSTETGATETGATETGATETGDTASHTGFEPSVSEDAPPDFELVDQNPGSARYGEWVSPRDYLRQVSGWYFTHAT